MSLDPLRQRFESVDTDGDGTINQAEMQKLLDLLGAGYDDAQVRAAFSAIDKDGNGHIELEDFRAWWQS